MLTLVPIKIEKMRTINCIVLLLVIFSCNKNNCDECNSELITVFEIRQLNNNDTIKTTFYINYDETEKIVSIYQEGLLQVNCGFEDTRFQSEDITYFYENNELKNAVSNIKEFEGDGFNNLIFDGKLYKSYTRVVENDYTNVFEVIDSFEANGNYTYRDDTIRYSYENSKTSYIEYFKSGIKKDFQYDDKDNLFVIACSKENIDNVNIIEWFNFVDHKNPFKIINEKLGYTKFTNIQFHSEDVYSKASYGGPVNPGQGSAINNKDEVILDCNNDVISIGDEYIIMGKLCK